MKAKNQKITLENILVKNAVLNTSISNNLSIKERILKTQEQQVKILACKKFDPKILRLVINPYLSIKKNRGG